MKAMILLLAVLGTRSLSYASVECQVLYSPYPASPITSPGQIRMQSLELSGTNEISVNVMGFTAKATIEQTPSDQNFLTVEITKGETRTRNVLNLTAIAPGYTQLAVTNLVVGNNQVTVNCIRPR